MPAVRFVGFGISLTSLLVSVWALRKTNLAVRTFRSNVLAEHARFLESQWVSIYQLTLTNDKFAMYAAEMFDLGSAETAQRDASLLMYINVLAMTFSSWQNKVIDDGAYKAHMESFFGTYRGDGTDLNSSHRSAMTISSAQRAGVFGAHWVTPLRGARTVRRLIRRAVLTATKRWQGWLCSVLVGEPG
jgi:hypothetical protein